MGRRVYRDHWPSASVPIYLFTLGTTTGAFWNCFIFIFNDIFNETFTRYFVLLWIELRKYSYIVFSIIYSVMNCLLIVTILRYQILYLTSTKYLLSSIISFENNESNLKTLSKLFVMYDLKFLCNLNQRLKF